MRTSRIALSTALVAVIAASAVGCTTSDDTETVEVYTPELAISDPWVKAVDDGMTGVFGEFANETDQEVHIVGASTDAAAMVELHETVDGDDGSMMMQEVDGGFTVAPGETLTLEPGGLHLMLMGVTEAIEPGDEIAVTLEFAGGATEEFTATAKEYSGANEEYTGDGDEE